MDIKPSELPAANYSPHSHGAQEIELTDPVWILWNVVTLSQSFYFFSFHTITYLSKEHEANIVP